VARVDPRGAKLAARFRALRAFSFPLSLLPIVVAAAVVRPVDEWRWDTLAASLGAVMLFHAAGNMINDCFDYIRGVDIGRETYRGRLGAVLVAGELEVSDMAYGALVCLLLAALPMAYLAGALGAGVLWFAVPAVFALYAYTGPPFRLKHRGLGELVIFPVFGPALMLGAAYAQTVEVEWRVLMLSLPVGFATTAVLAGNNLRDFDEDREAGIRTLAHALGRRGAGALYAALVSAFALGIGAMGASGLGPWQLGLVPALLPLHFRAMGSALKGEAAVDVDARAVRFESLVLIVVLAIYMFSW